MGNPNILNVLLLFTIVIYEAMCIYLRFSLFHIINSRIVQYIYTHLDIINKYYLEKRNNFISYILNKKTVFLNYLFNKEKVNKINSDEDALSFLNKLKVN